MATRRPARVLNSAGTHVYLANADTGAVWECPLDYVDVARKRGWEYTDQPDTSLDGLFDTATAEGPAQTGFDPADHNVDEVNDHLAQMHDAGVDGEVERVLALEAAGQNRKTIVDPRPAVDDGNTSTPITNPGD